MQMDIQRIQNFVSSVTSQFNNRTVVEGRKQGLDYGISLSTTIDASNILWLVFNKEGEQHCVTIPLPYVENGVQFIKTQNEVVRATCPFWIEKEQREMDYLTVMHTVALGIPEGLIAKNLIKATPLLQQVVYGFKNGNAAMAIYRFQRAVNDVVNRMPLHETLMNSFVMNNRLIIVDPEFEELSSPDDKLKYQKTKAEKYFQSGWTAIGLSDGTLASKNYILRTDLRLLSPFGLRYHNPQRNLYSTLGMKGDEEPLIRSESMQHLMNYGIARKGWNLFTAFVDVPDTFEDQIVVDRRLVEKSVTAERRYQIFGEMLVKEGDAIKTGGVIGFSPDGQKTIFKVFCESAKVEKVVKSFTSVGGTVTPVHNVVISYKRYFKDGFKITNLHGNKGVVRVADIGYAIDPRTGEKRKIDVIVGAKTVDKRKNYGQVLEAIYNCAYEADHEVQGGERHPAVLPDDFTQPMKQIMDGLVRRGFRKDGTWDCDTYAGKVKTVCGTVFWGCIKTPEDQLWQDGATLARNGKEVRIAGLKFSHIELRALETTFGKDNPIVDELMGYAQGGENIAEIIDMVRAQTGVLPQGKLCVTVDKVKPLDQTHGTIAPASAIAGTVVDEFVKPDGFILQLPLPLLTLVDADGEVLHEGSNLILNQMSEEAKNAIAESYITDKLYIPSGLLRKCWRHDTGKFGMSEVGVIVNNVVAMSHRLLANPHDATSLRLYYNAVCQFFNRATAMLCFKRGEIAVHAMSIRHPFSAKAVATLSTTLPKNTIEIHRDMAKQLKVRNGDVVLSERFPCLGFMSVRPQKIRVTDDPMCKYVLRVSNNSLVCQNLDFDGDVGYIAAFHTPAAKLALQKEFNNPNKACHVEIKRLNERKGAPHLKAYKLEDFNISPFDDLTNEKHATIVEKNTGVKAQTGPVMALTYNIMRIVENSDMANSQKMKVAIEVFLEKAAQSVFEQKHGGKSLHEIVFDGVCTANVEMLCEVGFKRGTTEKLCALIRSKAASIGVHDLDKFHSDAKEKGRSNIVSRIIKLQHRIYFASRSRLHGTTLLKALNGPAVDIPSRMFKWTMADDRRKNTLLEDILTSEKVEGINTESIKEACLTMCGIVDDLLKPKRPSDRLAQIRNQLITGFQSTTKGEYGLCHAPLR